ncbi:MAG: diacylglycerol kinase [Pirellulales bacterium]|nr:diacylglycerol kinase [Pirellulales bacterium]
MGEQGQNEPTIQPHHHGSCGWAEKFGCAFRGIACGIRGQRSYLVHLPMAAAVVACAAAFRASLVEWCVLLLCIAIVLTAELFNTALEQLAKMITAAHDPRMRDALDIGSAAVLTASIGAAIVGAAIFLNLVWPK